MSQQRDLISHFTHHFLANPPVCISGITHQALRCFWFTNDEMSFLVEPKHLIHTIAGNMHLQHFTLCTSPLRSSYFYNTYKP